MDFKYCKLEIFIPESHIPQLQKALQSVDAGHIGNYDSCMVLLAAHQLLETSGRNRSLYWKSRRNQLRAGGESGSNGIYRKGG